MGRFLGTHAIFDLRFDVDSFCLKDSFEFEQALVKVLNQNNCTILDFSKSSFENAGFTFVYHLSESHASCHTWPEYGIATFDVYTCGDSDAFKIMKEFISQLEVRGISVINTFETKLNRGWIHEEGTDSKVQ